MFCQGPRCAAAVANRVLLGRGELGHRPGVLRARVLRNEGRVIPEAAGPPRLRREGPLATSFEEALLAVLADERDRADVGDPAVVDPGHFVEQLAQVLLVARALAGEAGGAHPGAAAEAVGLDAGVIGDRGAPGRRARRSR